MAFSEHTFFFSLTNDVTLTQQRIALLQPKQLNDPIWTRADHRFFWNRDLVIDLITNDKDDWIVPFMSAFVDVRTECQVEDVKFTLLFVSRRSKYRQGCRFTKRGLDENGQVANFVETEQILIFPDGKITSYVQIRGSIPLKWSSPVYMKYDPVVIIDPDRRTSNEYAAKHVSELLDTYCDNNGNSGVIFINLVDNKKDQGKLGVHFKETIESAAVRQKCNSHSLTYVWFDFHHECKKKGKWNNLGKLVTQLDEMFRAQRHFCRLGNGSVTSWQCGVLRTNCMDNLDRTNVVQSLFARRSLIIQTGKGSVLDTGISVLDSPWKNFEKVFKTVWANNANAMSFSYAGTGALKVDFTKTGKRTLKGMLDDGFNSCMRYYINNFTDGIKQDAIDLMLGLYHPEMALPSPFTHRTTQQSLSSNLTKGFVFLLMIFSALIVVLPPLLPTTTVHSSQSSVVERNLVHLRLQLLLAVGVTAVVGLYVLYCVVKKGSKIGERLVIHPELIPEPLPAGRAA